MWAVFIFLPDLRIRHRRTTDYGGLVLSKLIFKLTTQLVALCLLVIKYAIAVSALWLYGHKLYNSPMMENRIKEARKALGWSQAELARRMFVTQPSVAAWELGLKAPHMKNMPRLAMQLGVSFEWLTTGRGDMHTFTSPDAREPSTDDWILPEERRLLSTYSRLKPQQRTA